MRALLMGLCFAFWFSPAYAGKKKNPYPHCETLRSRYLGMIEKLPDKAQRCKKDDDCDLLFEGSKFSGCDLGIAYSKTATGKAWEKKLDTAREKAEDACPEHYDQMHCMAEPYTKAVCTKGYCGPSY